MEIGDKIIQLREFKNISQEQLSETLKVPYELIVSWEKNESIPDLSNLILVSKYFNIKIDELINNNLENIPCNESLLLNTVNSKRQPQKKMMLQLSAIITILFSIVTIILLCAINEAVIHIEYMMYRYVTVGEIVTLSVSQPLLYIVPVFLFLVGLTLFLMSNKLKG